jgi:hypothetical protein
VNPDDRNSGPVCRVIETQIFESCVIHAVVDKVIVIINLRVDATLQAVEINGPLPAWVHHLPTPLL